MRYKYMDRAYHRYGAVHGVYCDPVMTKDGVCIVGRGNSLFGLRTVQSALFSGSACVWTARCLFLENVVKKKGWFMMNFERELKLIRLMKDYLDQSCFETSAEIYFSVQVNHFVQILESFVKFCINKN